MTETDELTFQQRVAQRIEQASQELAGEAPQEPAEADTEADTTPVEIEEPTDEEPAVVEEEPETPLEEEPAAEPEAEEPEEPEEPEELLEEDEFYVARYRDRETAEEALAEKDRTIQRLYQELNERQTQQPVEQEPQQIDIQAWSNWAAEAVENGQGIRGANQALESGGTQGFDIYMAHWMAVDDPDERVQAVAFNNEVQRLASTQSALQAMQPALQQSQEQRVAEEAMLARSIAASKHPDFDDYSDEMDRIMNTEDGPLDAGIKQWLFDEAQKGVEGKARAWEYVYLAAQASRAPRRQEARKVERTRRTSSADAAKIAATVSTSEGTGAHTPPNEAELAVLRKRNAIREKLGQPLIEE